MEIARAGDRLEAKTDHAGAKRQFRWSGVQPGRRALAVRCGTGAVARLMDTPVGPDCVQALGLSAVHQEHGHQLATRAQATSGARLASAKPM
jgi:hypothetical protein